MNPKLQILLIVVLFTGIGMLYDTTKPPPPRTTDALVTDIVPDITYTPQGQEAPTTLYSLKGKVVLLNFWASWCGPCKEEFPLLFGLAKEFPQDVVLLAISSDDKQSQMQRFLDRLGKEHREALALPNVQMVWDENKAITQDIFHTYRYPETIIIDPKGRMQGKLSGAIQPKHLPEIREFIAKIAQK